MAQLPGLIEKSEPALESALINAIQTMPPPRVRMFAQNLAKLNSAVQKAAQPSPNAVPVTVPAPVPMGGKRTKSSKKTRRTKRI